MATLAEKIGFGPTRIETQLPDGNWKIEVTPPAILGYPTQSVTLSPEEMEGYRRWKAGEVIQSALPNLSAADREILMTGIGDADFKAIFADDEEEDE